MTLPEILLIIAIIAFVTFIFGREIYRKIKKIPSGECSCCHLSSKRLLKNYRKKYKKTSCSSQKE